MRQSSSESSKANTIGHGKEGAKVEGAFLFISINIQLEVGIYNRRCLVPLAGGIKEMGGENGEGLGLVHIEPICGGYQDVHNDHIAGSNIGRGKPGAGQGTSKVGGHRRPVQGKGANTHPIEARANLLSCDRTGEDPADP